MAFPSLVAHGREAPPSVTMAWIACAGRSAAMTRAVRVPYTVEPDPTDRASGVAVAWPTRYSSDYSGARKAGCTRSDAVRTSVTN